MRTTLRIDDDLMRQIKARTQHEDVSVTELVNHLIRCGLEAAQSQARMSQASFRQTTFAMGRPRIPLDKALASASALEDEEVLEKIARRK